MDDALLGSIEAAGDQVPEQNICEHALAALHFHSIRDVQQPQ
jgi:hypothetical protein